MKEPIHEKLCQRICIYIAEFVGHCQRTLNWTVQGREPSVKCLSETVPILAVQVKKIIDVFETDISAGEYWFDLNRIRFPGISKHKLRELVWFASDSKLAIATRTTINSFWKFLDCPEEITDKPPLLSVARSSEGVEFVYSDLNYGEEVGAEKVVEGNMLTSKFLSIGDDDNPQGLCFRVGPFYPVEARKNRPKFCVASQDFIRRWCITKPESNPTKLLENVIGRLAIWDLEHAWKHFADLKKNVGILRDTLYGSPYLGLEWDEQNDEIRRVGFERTICFGGANLQRKMFECIFETGNIGVSADELSCLLHNGKNKRLDNIRDTLNKRLEPIGVMVELNKHIFYLTDS